MAVTIDLNISHQQIPQGGLLRLLEEDKYTDVTFCISGSRVRAHRVIVASQSDYFDCLLFGHMKEAKASEVTLEDTPLAAFRVLLRYMYSGTVVTAIEIETALDLLCLVDKYGFEQLRESLELELCGSVNLSNVLQLFFGAEVYNMKTLRQHCESLINANAQALLAGDTIFPLPWENLKYLITRDSFVVDEIHVFHAVRRWKEHNEASSKELSELLRCVRLSEIPKEEVISVVAPSGMYSASLLYTSLEAQRKQALLPTRGRQPGGNLFASEGTCVRRYSNYEVKVLPEKFPEAKAITDLTFQLSIQAQAIQDPSTIVVQLDDLYLINELSLEGYPGLGRWEEEVKEQQPFCYRVEVAKENSKWVTVIDYSSLRCYSTQQLYFPKQAVRFIQLVQTRGHEMYTIQLRSCSYSTEVPTKFTFRENGILAPVTMFEPVYSQFTCNSGVWLRCFVKFNQPYSVSLIRFSISGIEEMLVGQLTVSVSTQNKLRCYQEVANLRSHLLSAPVTVSFEERPVSIVSITFFEFLNTNGKVVPLNSQHYKVTVSDLSCQAIEVLQKKLK